MLTQKSSPLIDKMAPGHLINRGDGNLKATQGKLAAVWSGAILRLQNRL